ncbi:DUF357 domain-containing protein [Candidatus Micrarchaeota archaeon]|nr:DUF357 domain-containing protein [Candidatus Micrarchaeota archaeon]
MDEKERTLKDIKKLEAVIEEFEDYGLPEEYAEPYEWAKNYLSDAKHYFKKEDYFSAFGCANYAYGIIDGILIHEGKRGEKN